MTTPTNFPSISIKECLELYNQKRYEKLCQILFDVLKHCNEVNYSAFGKTDLKSVNKYIEFMFFLLAQEDFRFPDNWIPLFIGTSHLFANLVAISGYRDTSGILRSLLYQEGNYVKLLFLYTCRNNVGIDTKALIAPNSKLATFWWNNFATAPPGTTSELVYNQIVKHFAEFPENLDLPDSRVQPTYFQCSYMGIDERQIKEWYNKQVRKFTCKQKIRSIPKKGRIAVVTDKWISTTAVYKSSYPQIAALAEKYDLTLICSSKAQMTQIDRTLFKRVMQVHAGMEKHDLSAIEKNDFELAYFTDIGMTDESVFLANTRIAPIMVCGYGHPASTYGSLVDYFIGGIDSERVDLWQENYSEHLVLIPGLGAHPVDPKYIKKYPQPTEITYINCCWTTSKINWPMLQMLQRIQKQVPKVCFQFFPSWTCTRYNNFPIMQREMHELLGDGVIIHPNLSYQDYLTRVEMGSLTIDSYPFGGYNTIVDSLFTGCPVVTIEGTKFYNRASTALTRRVGVDLSTKSISECENKVIMLLQNPELLEQERAKLVDEGRLRKLLLDTDEPQYFVKAISHIIANHPIADKSPVIIK